jgi:hypothetical protein
MRMTFQLVRAPNGKLRGIAILIGRGRVEAGRQGEVLWRICDLCTERQAIVFCKSDNAYVCEKCLPVHTMPGFCRFLSVSAAREISTAALMEMPQCR